jgi:hypothetical protein
MTLVGEEISEIFSFHSTRPPIDCHNRQRARSPARAEDCTSVQRRHRLGKVSDIDEPEGRMRVVRATLRGVLDRMAASARTQVAAGRPSHATCAGMGATLVACSFGL